MVELLFGVPEDVLVPALLLTLALFIWLALKSLMNMSPAKKASLPKKEAAKAPPM